MRVSFTADRRRGDRDGRAVAGATAQVDTRGMPPRILRRAPSRPSGTDARTSANTSRARSTALRVRYTSSGQREQPPAEGEDRADALVRHGDRERQHADEQERVPERDRGVGQVDVAVAEVRELVAYDRAEGRRVDELARDEAALERYGMTPRDARTRGPSATDRAGSSASSAPRPGRPPPRAPAARRRPRARRHGRADEGADAA